MSLNIKRKNLESISLFHKHRNLYRNVTFKKHLFLTYSTVSAIGYLSKLFIIIGYENTLVKHCIITWILKIRIIYNNDWCERVVQFIDHNVLRSSHFSFFSLCNKTIFLLIKWLFSMSEFELPVFFKSCTIDFSCSFTLVFILLSVSLT